MSTSKRNPARYLWRKFWRSRTRRGWVEFVSVLVVLILGGLVGGVTAVEGRLLNPRALLIAAAVVAAYKTIETVVDAFGDEDSDFDQALSEVFKFVAGWSALAATGYATVQTLLDGSYWFACTTLVFCLGFACWGAFRAETRSTSGPVSST